MRSSHIFHDALLSDRRAAEIPEAHDIFGWFVGSWDIDAVLHGANGHTEKRRGEVHASWILEGRAIQDLFIFPRRVERRADAGAQVRGDRYGTTLRTYDHLLQAWHVHFINPAAAESNAHLIARRDGNGITMDGRLSDNTPIRWRYGAIETTSFHYTAERRCAEAGSWELYLEVFGKTARDRIAPCPGFPSDGPRKAGLARSSDSPSP